MLQHPLPQGDQAQESSFWWGSIPTMLGMTLPPNSPLQPSKVMIRGEYMETDRSMQTWWVKCVFLRGVTKKMFTKIPSTNKQKSKE